MNSTFDILVTLLQQGHSLHIWVLVISDMTQFLILVPKVGYKKLIIDEPLVIIVALLVISYYKFLPITWVCVSSKRYFAYVCYNHSNVSYIFIIYKREKILLWICSWKKKIWFDYI